MTEEELRLVPVIVKGLEVRARENPIKGSEIVSAIIKQKEVYGIKSFSEPRLRKICNFIRIKKILPIISTHKGYYVSYNKEEISNQIKSLTERAEAILASAEGLKKFL